MRGPRLARLRPRFTSVHVLALVALFLALSSGAMAATKYLTANDQITQGDLAGSTYGNPVIAAGKVTTGKIADGAITSSKFDSSATHRTPRSSEGSTLRPLARRLPSSRSSG